MKKILIIGAGFLQSFVIKKAKELGYYTIAIDKNANSIGFQYADEYNVIDIIDKEACLKYALYKDIDGVLTAATDYGVLSASYIAEKMNLPGLKYESAKLVKNKYLVRRVLFENKVDDISKFFIIDSLNSIKYILPSITYPVIVKPCDGSGSKAINKANSVLELEKACRIAIKTSLVGKVLIEDFVLGKEYGVESFVYNDEIKVLGIIDKHMTKPPIFAELGHSSPTTLNNEMIEKIKKIVLKAIRTLKINYGAVNMDIIITKDNRICIIDVGARMGGNLIGSHIIPLSTGIDYMKILIQSAVGDPVDFENRESKKAVASNILTLKPGKILNLPNLEKIKEKYNVEIFHNLRVGKKINEYHNNLDGCGYVLATSNDVNEAIKNVKEAKKSIDLGIVREQLLKKP